MQPSKKSKTAKTSGAGAAKQGATGSQPAKAVSSSKNTKESF